MGLKRINRKNLPKWTRKLTVAEIRHLKENNSLTLAGIKKNIEHQKNSRFSSCYECTAIWLKLNEEGTIK